MAKDCVRGLQVCHYSCERNVLSSASPRQMGREGCGAHAVHPIQEYQQACDAHLEMRRESVHLFKV
jgi:hypothetical protein